MFPSLQSFVDLWNTAEFKGALHHSKVSMSVDKISIIYQVVDVFIVIDVKNKTTRIDTNFK